MPIRIRDATVKVGRVDTTLADLSPSFAGTHVAPANRAGVLRPRLQPFAANLSGTHTEEAIRTGIMDTTLEGARAQFEPDNYRVGRVAASVSSVTGSFGGTVGLPFVSQSHWILTGSDWNTTYSGPGWLAQRSDETLSHFDVLQERHMWCRLEGPGNGAYVSGEFNFDRIENMLNACAARGIMFMPLVMFKKFSLTSRPTPFGYSTAHAAPQDLVDAGYDYQTDGVDSPAGYVTAMWTPQCRVRFQRLCEEIYDRFGDNPWFAGVALEESSGFESYTGAPLQYTLERYKTEFNTLWRNLGDYAASYGRWFNPGFNFITQGAWPVPLDELEGHWSDICNGVDRQHTILYSPDMLMPGSTNYNGNDRRVYPFFSPNYSGRTSVINSFWRASSMQNHSLQDAHNGGYNVDRTFTTYRDSLDLDVCIWTAVPYWDYTFDVPRSGNTYGDMVGVARLPWGHSYNGNYAG